MIATGAMKVQMASVRQILLPAKTESSLPSTAVIGLLPLFAVQIETLPQSPWCFCKKIGMVYFPFITCDRKLKEEEMA